MLMIYSHIDPAIQEPTENDWIWNETPKEENPDPSWYEQFEEMFFGEDTQQQSQPQPDEPSYIDQQLDEVVMSNQAIQETSYQQHEVVQQSEPTLFYEEQPTQPSYQQQPEPVVFFEEQPTQPFYQEQVEPVVFYEQQPEQSVYQEQAEGVQYELQPVDGTINMFNTDHCIHTYNVVNTVEEVIYPSYDD